MVTAAAGVVLGILTADCVPILMLDADNKIAGALHAGWRGIIAGIVAAGVNAMAELGARRSGIAVAMGPSIGPCCFEVEADLSQRFAREIEIAPYNCRPGRPGKAYLDLRGILRDQFAHAGVRSDAILSVGPCTRCASAQYFSRRAAGGAITGLQLSFVGFPA